MISRAFLHFFVGLFINYNMCLNGTEFDKEKFTQNKPADVQKFLSVFFESQMFDIFLQERAIMNAQQLQNCLFEKECTLFKLDVNIEVSLNCDKCGVHLTDHYTVNDGKFLCQNCTKTSKSAKKFLKNLKRSSNKLPSMLADSNESPTNSGTSGDEATPSPSAASSSRFKRLFARKDKKEKEKTEKHDQFAEKDKPSDKVDSPKSDKLERPDNIRFSLPPKSPFDKTMIATRDRSSSEPNNAHLSKQKAGDRKSNVLARVAELQSEKNINIKSKEEQFAVVFNEIEEEKKREIETELELKLWRNNAKNQVDKVQLQESQ